MVPLPLHCACVFLYAVTTKLLHYTTHKSFGQFQLLPCQTPTTTTASGIGKMTLAHYIVLFVSYSYLIIIIYFTYFRIRFPHIFLYICIGAFLSLMMPWIGESLEFFWILYINFNSCFRPLFNFSQYCLFLSIYCNLP